MDQAYEPASEEPIQLGTYTRPKDHLPERESYEALCRGEGLKMVRYEERMAIRDSQHVFMWSELNRPSDFFRKDFVAERQVLFFEELK